MANAVYLTQKLEAAKTEINSILDFMSDAKGGKYNEAKSHMSRTEILGKKSEETFDEILLFNSQQSKAEDKVTYEQTPPVIGNSKILTYSLSQEFIFKTLNNNSSPITMISK